MADPTQNPTTHLDLNGRRRLHVLYASAVRGIRTDPETEAALKFAREVLQGDTPRDTPSVSLIARRALKLYRERLAAQIHNPEGLRYEKIAVRFGSRLPSIRRK